VDEPCETLRLCRIGLGTSCRKLMIHSCTSGRSYTVCTDQEICGGGCTIGESERDVTILDFIFDEPLFEVNVEVFRKRIC
jgi:hypothetical protein